MEIISISLSKAAQLLSEAGYDLPELEIQDSAKLLNQRVRKRLISQGENPQPDQQAPLAQHVIYSEDRQQVRILIPLSLENAHAKEQTVVAYPLRRMR